MMLRFVEWTSHHYGLPLVLNLTDRIRNIAINLIFLMKLIFQKASLFGLPWEVEYIKRINARILNLKRETSQKA